jgi:hypothetical protein
MGNGGVVITENKKCKIAVEISNGCRSLFRPLEFMNLGFVWDFGFDAWDLERDLRRKNNRKK